MSVRILPAAICCCSCLSSCWTNIAGQNIPSLFMPASYVLLPNIFHALWKVSVEKQSTNGLARRWYVNPRFCYVIRTLQSNRLQICWTFPTSLRSESSSKSTGIFLRWHSNGNLQKTRKVFCLLSFCLLIIKMIFMCGVDELYGLAGMLVCFYEPLVRLLLLVVSWLLC